jgi:hypothetical protein
LGESYRLGLSPYEGDIIVFVGRNKNRLKILAADETGLWLCSKLLHEGTVSRDFKFLNDSSVSIIAPSVVQLLIEGTKFKPVLRLENPEKRL